MQKLTEQLSAKEQEIAELNAMLEEAQAESESHQTALRDCQDMLEELQTFSQGQEARLQQLQQQLQVCGRHNAEGSAHMRRHDDLTVNSCMPCMCGSETIVKPGKFLC